MADNDLDASTDDGPMLALVTRKLERTKAERDGLRDEVERLTRAREECERQFQAKVNDVITEMDRADAAVREVAALRERVRHLAVELHDFVGKPEKRILGQVPFQDGLEHASWRASDKVRALLANPTPEAPDA